MLIVDDLLFGLPIKGVKWCLGQILQIAEKEMTNEQPIMQAILENEMAIEEGRIDKETYELRQNELMAALRQVREYKKQLAEEKARQAGYEKVPGSDMGPGGKAISGKASLDVGVDFGGWGGKSK